MDSTGARWTPSLTQLLALGVTASLKSVSLRKGRFQNRNDNIERSEEEQVRKYRGRLRTLLHTLPHLAKRCFLADFTIAAPTGALQLYSGRGTTQPIDMANLTRGNVRATECLKGGKDHGQQVVIELSLYRRNQARLMRRGADVPVSG